MADINEAGEVYIIGSHPSSEVVAQELAARHIGETAVIVSSDQRSFAERAQTIADRLKIGTVYTSNILHNTGFRPEGIGKLDRCLNRALKQAGVELEQGQDVVMLAPSSLARAVDEGGIPIDGLPSKEAGDVPILVPAGDFTWQNHRHDAGFENSYLN